MRPSDSYRIVGYGSGFAVNIRMFVPLQVWPALLPRSWLFKNRETVPAPETVNTPDAA